MSVAAVNSACDAIFTGQHRQECKDIAQCESSKRLWAAGDFVLRFSHFKITPGYRSLGPWKINTEVHPWAERKILRRSVTYGALAAWRISGGGSNGAPWWICAGRLGLR